MIAAMMIRAIFFPERVLKEKVDFIIKIQNLYMLCRSQMGGVIPSPGWGRLGICKIAKHTPGPPRQRGERGVEILNQLS